MSSPPKNTGCGPVNVFGGFDQTLFLGASVMSFSASAGWNEQVSEITVQVVEDTCVHPKVYYDTLLTQQEWNDSDPGFVGTTYPIIGAPVYFRVGDFEFSGLVQNWDESNSESGNPAYEIKIVDPRAILENGQIIIGEFSGSVGPIYNIINAYGFMESFGDACPQYYQSAPGVYIPGDEPPDEAVFGSPALAFGGANANDNGMQWNQILGATRILLSSFPAVSNIWSPYGRLAFKAPVVVGNGMGLMQADTVGGLAYYYIDLNEVPNAPSYWRLNGTNTSIMEAVSQICQDSGHDYYIDLIPVVGGVLGPGIHKFIKVRTADRVAAPALNSIDTFIGNAGREVISYRKGRELRNETTSSFVIGGPKQSFYQAEQNVDPEGDGNPDPIEADDIIIPYFGRKPSTGDVYLPERDDDGWWEVEIETIDLATQLGAPKYAKGIAATVVINEQEMLAAESGIDIWMSYASSYNTELWQTLNLDIGGIFDINHIFQLLIQIQPNLANNQPRPADFFAIRQGIFQPHIDGNLDFEIAQIAHAWLEKLVSEYYGKKYQVRVPFTCIKADPENDIILTSEEPTDGGWTEVTPVLELAHPSVFTDFFTLDDNRLGAFCRFDGANGLELSGLDLNDFVSTDVAGGKAWIKIGVEPEYVYLDTNTYFSPRAVITIPQTVKRIEVDPDFQQVAVGLQNLFAKFGALDGQMPMADIHDVVLEAFKGVGNISLHLALYNRAEMPDACGFGIKSNVLTYGPWGAAGPAGGVNVVNDEGLVPWEYGGFDTLDLAGLSIANEGVTNQQVSEAGEITVAGYPELPLGAELLAADTGGPFNGGGNNLVENRTVGSGSFSGSPYYFSTVFPWDGTFGPNVTGLTTTVGENGLQTTYSLKTWTPKFGRFFKGNAERLKQVGQQRLRYQKQIRAFLLHRVQRQHLNGLRANEANNRKGINLKNAGAFGEPQTPHEVFVGKLTKWNDGSYRRSIVASESIKELPVELADDYTKKALLSLDGLIRPVSMEGSGGLPPYATPISHCQTTISVGTQPPTDKVGEAGNFTQYNQTIDVEYLNPFSNPSPRPHSSPVTRSDTTTIGHDMEIIGRGEAALPNSGIIMPIEGYGDTGDLADSGYDDDYRTFALRGPLLVQGWGYDLDGFPVPNKADTEGNAELGVFTETSLQCKFMDNWLRKSHTWPVGPIDLRWDRKRAVWTVPQLRSVVGYLTEPLAAFGSATVRQTSGATKYDCEGASFDAEFEVFDRVGNALPSGNTIIAEYDPYACQYQVVECMPSGAGSGTGVNVVDTNCCLTPSAGFARPTLAIPFNTQYINFGAGLWLHKAVDSGETCGIGVAPAELTHVFAGFRPVNNSGECFVNGALTSDGSRFINVVDFQGGLRAIDGDDDCDLKVRAGIEASATTGTCFTTGVESVPLAHKLLFHRGLTVNPKNAGIGGQDDCTVNIGLGLGIHSWDGVDTEDEHDFSGGFRVSDLLFGPCLSVSGFGECSAVVDFAQKFDDEFSEDDAAFSIDVPTGAFNIICCEGEGACGISSFTLGTRRLLFNGCGQLISYTGGTNISVVCELEAPP